MAEPAAAAVIAAARWVRQFVEDHPEASRRQARRAMRRAGIHLPRRRFRMLWEWANVAALVGGAGTNHPLERYPELRTRFDERFRGAPEAIVARLEQYATRLDLARLAAIGPALDLGCGRGEWLDVLRRHGVPASGVDLDPAAVAALTGRGHAATTGDALAALRGRADRSLGLVSLFHLAEHLPFDTLLEVCREAHRVLAPGGVLLVETPNPRNLTVGAATFYLDPTHDRPLPPELLQFLGEAAGFTEVRVEQINPPAVPPFRAPAGFEDDPAFGHLVVELNRWLHGPLDAVLIAVRGG